MTEDEMAGWYHWLNGRESEWTPGVSDGQGGLACCDSWGRKKSDTTELLNWTELGCSLVGLMLKLKRQYFGHLMQRADTFEKTLMLAKIEGRRRRGGWDSWMASPTQWTWVWMASRSWWWTGRPGMLWFMGSQRVRHDWATELNSVLCNISLLN